MNCRCLAPVGALFLAAACVPKSPATGAAPGKGAGPSVAALPIPSVTGPTHIVVQYPAEDATIDARDSTFLLGSAGTGDATLSINGQPVKVWPNGAWLAWVPLPRPEPTAAGSQTSETLAFRLVAVSPRDSSSLLLKVRRAASVRPDSTGPYIDLTSFVPSGVAWVPASEDLRLQVRASPGARATLVLSDGSSLPLVEEPAADDVPAGIRAFDRDTTNLKPVVRSSRYVGVIRGHPLGDPLGPMLGSATPSPVPGAGSWARVRLEWPTRTLETVWPLRVSLVDTMPQVVRLDDDPAHGGGSDSITVGRAAPGATYNWFFPTGTRAVADRRQNSDVRLRLSSDTRAWVALADVQALSPGSWPPLGRIGSLTASAAPNRTTVRIPVGTRVPFHVSETGQAVSLRLYGAVADIDWTRYAPNDTLIERIDWQQDGDIVRIDVILKRSLYGYRTRWDGTDLLLDIRRPPAIDRSAPFRGRKIALDPGHPPGGATGPTGLREAEANLGIALQLQRMLQEAGATVIMTRSTDAALDLGPRIVLAEAADADVLVSIHNNALPDGVNPFTNNGTSVFYNHEQSLALARAVQKGLVSQLGLRDLGVGRGDLALVRPTWQPSILTEGLYMIVPEQEAALRSTEGQRRYALGVLDGLRTWLLEETRQ
jgi:N-acetylmuramoyl-L-alanine amidase